MTELVVISGKGGTGKTSVVASFAALAGSPVLADCDVDAADLHLVMHPEIRRRETFLCGHEAVIRAADCLRCGACLPLCRFDAVKTDGRPGGEAEIRIDPIACEGCGVCVRFCPAHAIDFPERRSGEWYLSETRFGPMIHARLGIAAENSGKLVTVVRTEARRIAEERGRDLVLVDGPPGIGCPVIASIAGATGVIVVTEPTPSGEHDLERVLRLASHFGIRAAVCVNRWDLAPELAERIERSAAGRGATIAGRIRYDRAVTAAQVAGVPVVEHSDGGAAGDIRSLWEGICRWIRDG